jgi:diguanylate cyclase (GGDEF)-like protein/PAS domain S-box-containing protein
MGELDNIEGSSSALARSALLSAAFLAAAGSGLGGIAVLRGDLSGLERALVLSCCVFSLAVVVTLLAFRKVAVQLVATASTIYFTTYLVACVTIAVHGKGENENLFIYLLWFFPMLVLNKLVNSPAIGRFFAKIILAAPFVILALLASKLILFLSVASRFHLAAYCLSYGCFGLMLTTVTRYREAYIIERERVESLKIESQVLESISDCFISLNSEFRLVYLNDAACTEFSVKRIAALKALIPNAVQGFFSSSMVAELQAAMRRPVASMFEAQNNRQDQWYEMRCFPRADGMSVYFRNITESALSRRKLDVANANLREQSELLDKAQDAIFVQDLDSRICYWNEGAKRVFGWSAEEVVGRTVGEIFDQDRAAVHVAFEHVLEQGEWIGELTKRDKDGRTLVVESRCTLVRDAEGKARSILAINTDVTERKAAEAKIEHLAFYDTLTDLPNRILLREQLDQALATSHLNDNIGALLFIDLDDFKTLNDTSGHETGDQLLRQIALRLESNLGKGHSLARLGGDEFVVLLEGLGSDAEIAATLATAVGEKTLQDLREPHLFGSREYQGTASVGVTLFRRRSDSVDDLLKQAEMAMYKAKELGRNTMCLFDPAMETAVAARGALQADLRRALRNDDFELHYQPQLNVDGRVTGAEALLRWRHRLRGMVPPSEFIPLAEEAGLIVELGAWVLETACKQLAVWAQQPELEGLTVAVNVSNRQILDSNFVPLVEDVLERSGANPRRLKIEITESSTMEKVNDTIAKMSRLKARGVGFSMDDFGTGYSSLSQLKRLPLDQLKIDQSFVRDVLNGAMDASIARTIITLGKNLNLMVIAEGVETEAQREFLERQGCQLYQGYLFSPAVPPSQFEAFVAARRPSISAELSGFLSGELCLEGDENTVEDCFPVQTWGADGGHVAQALFRDAGLSI